EILALVEGEKPIRGWVLAHPHKALELAGQWPQLLAAYAWLDAYRGSGRYLREISAPGVDTKFAERHRGVLATMLDVPGTPAGFRGWSRPAGGPGAASTPTASRSSTGYAPGCPGAARS